VAPVRELPERPAPAQRPQVAPSPGAPPEPTRDTHPPGASWRADALAASPHRRLADDIPLPLADFDAERAAAVCADISRDLLQDFAAGLVLLPAAERRRVQALAAYARTLFDFACQPGVEGERLAQINRWEWELEGALAGEPAGQPVFVALAEAERRRPWCRSGLAAMAALARRLASREQPAFAQAEAEALAAALAETLFDGPAGLATRAVGARALAAAGLTAGGAIEATARRDPAVARAAVEAPPAYRTFVRFIERGAAELLRQRAGGVGPPRLGLGTRLRYLVLARLQ